MSSVLAKNITHLNKTVLDCLNAPNEAVIVKKFIESGLSVLGADFGCSWIKDKTTKEFRLLYKSPTMPYTPDPPRKKSGVNSKTQRVKRPLLIYDVLRSKTAKADSKVYMRSVAVIPIVYKDDNYGNLIYCFKKTHFFTPEEESICEFIGNSAAQAIALNRLYANLKDFKSTLDNTLDSIFMFDPTTLRITYANRGALRLVGFSSRELCKKSFLQIQSGVSEAGFRELITPLLYKRNASQMFETTLKPKQGLRVPIEVSLQYVRSSNQPDRFLSIVRDISERKEAEETIKHHAYFDHLTDVPNRVFFTQRLMQTLEHAEKKKEMFAILFTDLDRFKFINDVLGHGLGDKLLTQVAQRLHGSLKQSDLVSRMGGDEFVILINRIKSDTEAKAVAKRIQEVFKNPFTLDGQEVYVNISIGISVYPLDGKDANTLLKNADIALRRAKEEGGANFQQYHSGISGATPIHLELEKKLRHAIRNRELVLYYQPQVDLATGQIIGCEALLRWHHPTLGTIYPGDFISRAEETGLIVEMGEWLMEEGVRQNKAWQDAGLPPIPVCVNLSPRQLLQQDLVEWVSELLKAYNLSPEYFELELTESVIMKNIDMAVEILEEFRAMGVRFLIDDFGTGYASLSYLKRLPVDALKIDKSFVHGSSSNQHDAAIITAVISIAHKMKLTVVAEGVETQQQMRFLRTQGCDVMQGHFFSKPLPAQEFARLLKHPPVVDLKKNTLFHLNPFHK